MVSSLHFYFLSILEKNKAHGLASKFSQSHGKLEDYNIGLKEKCKYKTHIHAETKECKIKVMKDKCDCDMVAWMG